MRRTFNNNNIELEELHISWDNIYNKFVDAFMARFKNKNKKLHFDFLRSKKDLKYTHVDGAKYNWIDPILLDTLLCYISNIIPTDHRSRRRTFNQQKILLDCIVEALDMESLNKGWNTAFISNIDTNEKNNSTSNNKHIISNIQQQDERNISLILNDLSDNWSNIHQFEIEIDKSTSKSKKKRNEICDILLKEIENRNENLSNIVINAICKIISNTDFKEYYRNNNIIIKSSNSRKHSNNTDMITKQSSNRKDDRKRKRQRNDSISNDDDEDLDDDLLGIDEYVTYENLSDLSSLNFDVYIASLNVESPLSSR